MYQTIIVATLYIASVYSAIGFLVALFFVFTRVGRIDPDAAGASIGFRMMIFPGTIVFWPLLIRRVFSGKSHPPDESTAHKRAVT